MSESSQNAIDKINQLANQATPTAPPVGQSAGLAAGAAAMASGSQAMLAQAQNGALSIDPQAGQSLIKSLQTQIDTLQALGGQVDRIGREVKLGMTPGGQVMSKFNQEVAATGSKAFAPAHKQLVKTLMTTVQAVQVAMDNYAAAENDNADKLKAKD
jgi:hypothetical protein